MSVGDFVGKLITNEMIVQIPMENSVDKSKDCGSDSSTTSHLLHAQVCLLLLSSFFFSFFLISILNEFCFFSLLSFICNHIKVRLFFIFFHVFFTIFVFILFLIVFVLNNFMNVVVGIFFSVWDQFLVDLFIGFLNFFHMNIFSWIYFFVLFICCKFVWVDFLLLFCKHFEYYRVLIYII